VSSLHTVEQLESTIALIAATVGTIC
jgi:hypothetical protein